MMTENPKSEAVLSTNARPDSDINFSELEKRMMKFWRWNGDPPAPQFSHWTSQGSVIVRAATAAKASVVIWKPKDGEENRLGYDDINPHFPLNNVVKGKYDDDAGVPISQLVPSDWATWNDLG